MNKPFAPRSLESGLVSIMMPAYNAEKYIGQAIESVLGQTYSHWELVIVNDGSSDGTAQAAAAFEDERIRLYNQPNGGEASARNHALEQSRGEYIAFLDADDLFLPHHLACTVEYLQNHPERDAVYTDGTYIDPQGSIIEPLSKRRRGPFEGDIFEQVVRASDVFGPPICILLRHQRVITHQVWFDTRIVIGPDWDFLTRFAENNSFGYVDAATCLYRLHPTSISVSTNQERRRLYLAICREKAIDLPGFARCSEEVRAYAFYDLLVNLLPGYPERREGILAWAQFKALPPCQQARLLRLTASSVILADESSAHARAWFARARTACPADLRSLFLALLLQLSPVLCRRVLAQRRAGGQP
jgi:glycosyltransferase involved in cell wall biosynthesis